MQIGTAPAMHDIARGAEGDDRRRGIAAFADAIWAGPVGRRRRRRIRIGCATAAAAGGAGHRERVLGVIEVLEVVAAMNDPDLIFLVDTETDVLAAAVVLRRGR